MICGRTWRVRRVGNIRQGSAVGGCTRASGGRGQQCKAEQKTKITSGKEKEGETRGKGEGEEKGEKEKGVSTGGQRADVGLARNGSAGGAYLLVALLLWSTRP